MEVAYESFQQYSVFDQRHYFHFYSTSVNFAMQKQDKWKISLRSKKLKGFQSFNEIF